MSTNIHGSNKVLVRQTKVILKGEKVLSSELLYEKPQVATVQIPSAGPPPIQTQKSPPSSPTSNYRPEFLEPLPSPKTTAFRKTYEEDLKRRQQEFLEWEANQPSTWMREIERLERERERFNKKRSWSAKDLAEVEKIDACIKDCEGILDRIIEEEEDEEIYDGYDSE